jgi:GR25 family glycosyltransferase involved in LPS biosynthesis
MWAQNFQRSIIVLSDAKPTDLWRATNAFVINGKRGGEIAEPRMSKTIEVCRNLNLTFERTPSVYYNTNLHCNLCGPQNEGRDRKFKSVHVKTFSELKTVKGCMAAHYHALQAISKQKRRQILFEDDVCLPRNEIARTQKALEQFMEKSQDVDIAYIGSHNVWYNKKSIGELTTHAMLIYPEGAKKLLELANWCSACPIDVMGARREGFNLKHKVGSWCDGIIHQNNLDGAQKLRDRSDF